MATIKNLRKKIDSIDTKMVALLNERANISKSIGDSKLKDNQSIYAPNREKEVLDRIRALNKGPMSADALQAIYREIMSSSLALENLSPVAHLGTKGSFTHMAAAKIFGSLVPYRGYASIQEVFDSVEDGDCSYGVVPIENSIEGAVTHTFDLLVESELKICAQRKMKIAHCLISSAKSLKSIKNVYSNPNALGQCRHWLARNLPTAGQISIASTTEAVQKIIGKKDSAAIASSLAAQVYDVPVLRRNIQDVAHNTTRFLVIAKHDVPPTGKDRTSILFSIKDKVGALHAMLTPFYRNKINLTKIESRPSKKRAWDYYFFVDIEGHRKDKKVQRALNQLEGMCKYLKILGSYPIIE